ncbi:hypothetical protein HBHAL_2006 [Halobacillus halophilus DSM 2266]|uniref:Uncharacterized protein n=2 Tax=Halobacillus halophilus TaxID=1570 RepID=I0JJP8_HALH3|nr:hypothetical protein HBHAL_2006 [Halobacillus halophilus DSM 2266]
MLFSGTKISDLTKGSIGLLLLGFIFLSGSFYMFVELAEGILQKEKFAIDEKAFNCL